jgi:hypothetical protein
MLEPSESYMKMPDNNWTKIKERKLSEWQQQSKLHAIGHELAQENYSKKNARILIPSIIFGTLATFFDGLALIWEDQHVIFIILALLLTAVVTILGGILQTTKPADEASGHEEMAKGYNKIVLQIDSMLVKEYTERENGSQFLTKVEEELITLQTGGAKVPNNVWKIIKNAFLAGELDFQKMETKFPRRATIRRKSHIVTPDATIVEVNAPSPTSTSTSTSTPTPTSTSTPTPTSTSTSINITTEPDSDSDSEPDELPTFEFNFATPIAKKAASAVFDFQMRRLGAC